MRSRIVAFAALVLASGYGAAMAQSNAPTLNAAPTVTTTPSGPGAPVIPAAPSQVNNPAMNPSAAGTQTGRERSGSSGSTVEHSGSQTLDANTHPLKAVKENRRLRKQERRNKTGLPPAR